VSVSNVSVVQIRIEGEKSSTKDPSQQTESQKPQNDHVPGFIEENSIPKKDGGKDLQGLVESTLKVVTQDEKRDYFSIHITSVTYTHTQQTFSEKDKEDCKKRLEELEQEINKLNLIIFKNEFCISTQGNLEKQVEANPQAWDRLQALRCEQMKLKQKQAEIEQFFRHNKPQKACCAIM
jgi:hypothetical protein